MIRSFFRHSIIYTISGLLTRGVPIILLPFYTRILSTREFGYWEYISSLGGLLLVLLPLEITQGMARFYSEASTEKDRINYSYSTLIFTIFGYSIFSIIVIFYSNFFSNFFFDGFGGRTTLLLCLVLYLVNGVVYSTQNILRWSMNVRGVAIMSLIIAVISILISVLFLILNYGLNGLIIASIFSGLFGLLYTFFMTKEIKMGDFEWAKVKQMLKFSLPLVPSSLGVVLALYVDRLLVKSMLDVESMAYYSLAYRLSTLVIFVTIGFQGALTPLVYKNYKRSEARNEIANLFRICSAIALLFCVSICLFIKEIINIFFINSYESIFNLVPFLVLSALIWQMYVFAPGLNIAKKTKLVAIINLSVAIFNLILNYFFILYFGLIGSAVATLIAAIFSFCINMYYSQKFYYIEHNWRKLIIGFMISLLYILSGIMLPLNLSLTILKVLSLTILVFLFIKIKLLYKNDLKLLTD